MIHLSRLLLNPRSRTVRRDLADCHDLHRTVLRAFPQVTQADGARNHLAVLHRVDLTRPGQQVSLLVQSSPEPDWAPLPADYLLDTELENPAVKRIDTYYDAICDGTVLLFRLRANPTKRISDRAVGEDARWRGKRVELQREEDQLAWLGRKGEAGGFRLLSVHAQPDVLNVLALHGEKASGKRNGARVTFGSVLFEGELQVTDAVAFRQALEQGIGSGKAYGFGLLSVASAAS